MSSRFLEYWKNIDLFGVAPVLSFQGKGKQKTSIGAFISIFILGFIIFSTIFSFKDMVLRQNPNTVISNGIGRQKDVRLSENGFQIGFALLNIYTGDVVVDPAIMVPNFFTYKTDPTSTPTNPKPPIINPVKYTSCTYNHFTGSTHGLIPAAYCFELDNNITIGNTENGGVAVQFLKCNNATSSVTCKTQQEIDTIFSTYEFLVLHQNRYIDPSDYDQPVKYNMDAFSFLGSATMTKVVTIYLNEIEYETDKGWLFSDTDQNTYLGMDNYQPDVSDGGTPTLGAFIFMQGKKEVHKRHYMKFQQSLAGTFSLIRVAFLVCAFLVVPCTKTNFYSDMISELFSLNEDHETTKSQFKTDQFGIDQRRLSFSQRNDLDSSDMSYQNNLLNISSRKTSTKSLGQVVPIKFPESKFKLDAAAMRPESVNNSINFDKDNNTHDEGQVNVNLNVLPPINNEQYAKNFSQEEQPKVVQMNPEDMTLDPPPSENFRINIDTPNNLDGQKLSLNNLKPADDGEKEGTSEKSNSPKQQEKEFQEEISKNQSQVKQQPQQQELLKQTQKIDGSSSRFSPAVLQWFYNALPCYKQKSKSYFKTGKNKIQSDLCVTTLVKKLRELERMKVLLLDENQRVLFDNLPKPRISAPNYIPNSLERDMLQSNQIKINKKERVDKLNEFRQQISIKKNKSRLDMKLLQWHETGNYIE